MPRMGFSAAVFALRQARPSRCQPAQAEFEAQRRVAHRTSIFFDGVIAIRAFRVVRTGSARMEEPLPHPAEPQAGRCARIPKPNTPSRRRAALPRRVGTDMSCGTRAGHAGINAV
jgi:hypothetical protein